MTKKELFMANVRGEYTSRSPIWIMRQAGRYLPEYRVFRKTISFEDLCKTPKAVAEVTAQPIEILNLDAAIIFADILLILEPLGIDLTFDPGPVIKPLLEKPEQVAGYAQFDAGARLSYVGDAIIETRKRIGHDIALLGFCGAPFTVFCYLCGTKGSKDFYKPIRFLTTYPRESKEILERLTELSISYLKMQVSAGADAVQLFDTWAGELARDEFALWSLPYLKRIIKELRQSQITTSVYIKDAYHLLGQMKTLDAQIFSLDWRTPLSEAAQLLAPKAIQGNLDPHLMLGSEKMVVDKALGLMNEMKEYSGYIFNLGHGILPETPIENVKAVVEMVHEYSKR